MHRLFETTVLTQKYVEQHKMKTVTGGEGSEPKIQHPYFDLTLAS